MTGARPRLFTIGYEQTPARAVLDRLQEAGVQLVVDVRAVAASRRPGFSKRQLAAGLDERRVSYLHLRGLGTPKEGRVAARRGDAAAMARIYRTHLTTPQAREEMDALTELVRSGRRLCLLCYERDPAHCHRRILAEMLHERTKIAVEDLFCAPV